MGIVSPMMAQWLLLSIVVLNHLNLTLASGDSKISCMKCVFCSNWKGEVKTLKPIACPYYTDSCKVQISKTEFDRGEGIKAVSDRACHEIRDKWNTSLPGCHETVDNEDKPIIVCVCTGDECNGGNNLTAIMEAAERSAEHFNITAYKQLISEKKANNKSSQILSGVTIWIAGSLAFIFILPYWV